jgi:hypothetical protein
MENKDIQTQPYVAPLIEVIEVRVEQGFAITGGNESLDPTEDEIGWE